jgi:hypothetical protein
LGANFNAPTEVMSSIARLAFIFVFPSFFSARRIAYAKAQNTSASWHNRLVLGALRNIFMKVKLKILNDYMQRLIVFPT